MIVFDIVSDENFSGQQEVTPTTQCLDCPEPREYFVVYITEPFGKYVFL